MKYSFQMNARLAKRCPFCGGNNIVTEKPEWLVEHGIRHFTFECMECGCEYDGDSKEDLKEAYREALKGWNRRCVA